MFSTNTAVLRILTLSTIKQKTAVFRRNVSTKIIVLVTAAYDVKM